MNTGISLAELSRRNVAILPHEAVAIAQKLINGTCAGDDAHAPYGPLSRETVVISADGSVHCRGSAATPSVSEVAIFLQSLLEGRRVPGGLRYAIGRALLDVDAPPFDSVRDLSAALARFEDGDRDAMVAGLARRASAEGRTGGLDGGPRTVDRRRQAPTVATLRQELRLADLRLYQARLAERAPHGFSRPVPRGRRRSSALSAPVAACMLAGVALVVAGDVSERRTARPAESQVPSAVSEPAAGAARVARTADIPLPPASGEAGGAIPVSRIQNRGVLQTVAATREGSSGEGRVATAKAPRAGSPGKQTRARRATASRPAERPRATPSRRAAEDHDAFLARIRFEWDKRGH